MTERSLYVRCEYFFSFDFFHGSMSFLIMPISDEKIIASKHPWDVLKVSSRIIKKGKLNLKFTFSAQSTSAAWGGGPHATFYEGAGLGPLIHRLTSRCRWEG